MLTLKSIAQKNILLKFVGKLIFESSFTSDEQFSKEYNQI